MAVIFIIIISGKVVPNNFFALGMDGFLSFFVPLRVFSVSFASINCDVVFLPTPAKEIILVLVHLSFFTYGIPIINL